MTHFPPLLINMCSYGHPTQRQNGEYYNRFALPAIILAFYVIRPIWEINGAVVELIADEKYSFYTEFTGGTKYANEELATEVKSAIRRGQSVTKCRKPPFSASLNV